MVCENASCATVISLVRWISGEIQGGVAVVRRFLRLAVIVAFPLTIGLVPSAASAGQVFQSASIQMNNTAQLVSMVEVDATVHYNCFAPSPGTLIVQISQGGVTSSGSAPATCDDSHYIATVQVIGGPFVAGPAVATYFVENADFSSIAEVIGDEINIR